MVALGMAQQPQQQESSTTRTNNNHNLLFPLPPPLPLRLPVLQVAEALPMKLPPPLTWAINPHAPRVCQDHDPSHVTLDHAIWWCPTTTTTSNTTTSTTTQIVPHGSSILVYYYSNQNKDKDDISEWLTPTTTHQVTAPGTFQVTMVVPQEHQKIWSRRLESSMQQLVRAWPMIITDVSVQFVVLPTQQQQQPLEDFLKEEPLSSLLSSSSSQLHLVFYVPTTTTTSPTAVDDETNNNNNTEQPQQQQQQQKPQMSFWKLHPTPNSNNNHNNKEESVMVVVVVGDEGTTTTTSDDDNDNDDIGVVWKQQQQQQQEPLFQKVLDDWLARHLGIPVDLMLLHNNNHQQQVMNIPTWYVEWYYYQVSSQILYPQILQEMERTQHLLTPETKLLLSSSLWNDTKFLHDHHDSYYQDYHHALKGFREQYLQLLTSASSSQNYKMTSGFPLEHYAAIFLPLLFPLCLPFFASTIKELKRYREKKKKTKQRQQDEGGPNTTTTTIKEKKDQ